MTTKRPTPMMSLSRHSTLGRLVRGLAHPLALLMAASSVPAWAGGGAVAPGRAESAAEAAPTLPESALPQQPGPAPAPPPPLIANRTRPQVAPPPAYATFSEAPSVEDVFRARVFGEPLVPIGGDPSEPETRDLAKAIEDFQRKGDLEKTSPFEDFLEEHPGSAWRASLLANLGATYRLANRFTKAEEALERAWQAARGEDGPRAAAVGDKALADQLDLHMVFGRQRPIERLLAEAEGRDVQGSAVETLEFARWTVNGLANAHEKAVPSGPVALDQILRYLGRGEAEETTAPAPSEVVEGSEAQEMHNPKGGRLLHHKVLAAFHATPEGASLVDMHALAGEVGLRMQMAYRADGRARIPVPSVMHIKAQHFAAVVGIGEDGSVKLRDPLLGGDVYLSPLVTREESSGYFLIPEGALPNGWRAADDKAAREIRGKCHYSFLDPFATFFDIPQPAAPVPAPEPSPQPTPTCPPGMASSGIQLLLVGATIMDSPVGYVPPRGPGGYFTVRHNHRETGQPGIFPFSNLGQKWTHDWLSYVEDNPTNPSANAYLFVRGGGRETLSGFDGSAYAPHYFSRGVLRRVTSSPIRYERTLPDGGVEVFTLSDGAATSPRRVFLTEARDPQGNALLLSYDSQLRLVSLTDAVGQVTILSYETPSDPLKITKVTDPFGRSARFEYNDSGQLVRIVDAIGMASSFEYGTGGYVRALTTPYGTTTYRWGAVTTLVGFEPMRWLEVTDPLGATERAEFWMSSIQVPATDPAAQVPTGITDNSNLGQRNTYYWDKRAHQLHPGDQTKSEITHWLQSDIFAIAPIPGWVKKPLENRVWYQQASPPIPGGIGPSGRPALVGRVLDNGASQISRYEWGTRGNLTRYTDPLGRETLYEFDANDIDLLRIKQKNPGAAGGYDLLLSLTYNAQHQPLTSTDASGQVTTFTYLSDGRPQSVVTAPRAGLTAAQRTTTFAYFGDAAPLGPGRLQTLTGPSHPQGSPTLGLTYDAYGRLRTMTDSDAYALTVDWDGLDRPTRVTYPDATYEEVQYSRLDAEKHRDRLGRWSETFFDALRRPVTVRDPLGRTTTMQWCACGSMDKLIDANGNITTWERDLQARVTREVRANGSDIDYVYETTTSRLKQVTDPKNQTTNLVYALDGNLAQVSYPNAVIATPSVNMTYDPLYDRVATVADGVGTTTYTYNPITAPLTPGEGRLASVDGPYTTDTVSYTYEELGRVASRGLSGATRSFTFDSLGRLTTLGSLIGNFTYTYAGPTGRRATATYPNGQVTAYSYLGTTGDLRLQEIKHQATSGGTVLSKFNYLYDTVGNIKTWTQQYQTDPAKAYDFLNDRADQLTSATHRTTDPVPVTLKRYAYAYDPAGNRTADQTDNAVIGASYDNVNRLTSRQPGGALLLRGSLNEAATVTVGGTPATVASNNKFEGAAPVTSGTSNVVVAATDPSGNTRTNTYQITQAGATTSFTYDANGNLTGDGTKTYEWDAANRLVAVKQGAATLASFVYDGQGRRVQKIAGGVTRTYIYDGEDIVEERLSSGGPIKYVHGAGIDEPLAHQDGGGAVTYYLADHLGSIVQTTNTAKAVTLTREYDPWGNMTAGTSTSGYAFTGREWDPETNLYYYRARYYDPKVGRFISEDPIGLGGGINRYAYVDNQPLTSIDPDGENALVVGAAVGLGVLAVLTVKAAYDASKATWDYLTTKPADISQGQQTEASKKGERSLEKGGGDDPYWTSPIKDLRKIERSRDSTPQEKERARRIRKQRMKRGEREPKDTGSSSSGDKSGGSGQDRCEN